MSSPVVKYKIVETATVQTLEWQVNLWIEKGWAPIGGLAIGPGPTPYKQSMVKRIEVAGGQKTIVQGRKLLEGEIVD